MREASRSWSSLFCEVLAATIFVDIRIVDVWSSINMSDQLTIYPALAEGPSGTDSALQLHISPKTNKAILPSCLYDQVHCG